MAKAYLYDLTDTWNAGATTFTAVKMNVTDTASAAGSALIDLQLGGVSQFKVSKAGAATITTIELGNASDTTLSRSSAGVLAVEGVVVPTISSSNTLTNKTLSSPTLSGTVSGTPTFSGAVAFGAAITQPTNMVNTTYHRAGYAEVSSHAGGYGVFGSNVFANWDNSSVTYKIVSSTSTGYTIIQAGYGEISLAGATGSVTAGDTVTPAFNVKFTPAGKVLAVAGIGVGNSASASLIPTSNLVKKIEVFDASGVSLGFIPVYSSIT
jgi:hypothetical protein